jgi:hypothetical protein
MDRDQRLRQIQARKDREATDAARSAAGAMGAGHSISGGHRRQGQQQQQRRHDDDDVGTKKYAAEGVFSASYHAVYKDSPWVVVTGLPTTITEGDVAAIAAQYGTIVDVRLDRSWHRVAEDSNKPRRFADGTFLSGKAFVAFADPRSCVLVTDNLQGYVLEPKNVDALPDDLAAAGGMSRPPQPLRWDHCHEAQVAPLPADVPTYAEWLHAQRAVEAREVAGIMRAKKGVARAGLALTLSTADVEV